MVELHILNLINPYVLLCPMRGTRAHLRGHNALVMARKLEGKKTDSGIEIDRKIARAISNSRFDERFEQQIIYLKETFGIELVFNAEDILLHRFIAETGCFRTGGNRAITRRQLNF